LAGRRASIHH
jgi:hypothetical protein